MHKAFVITKEVDKSSPLLYKLIASNEILSEVTIQFMRANAGPTGQEQAILTVTLTNASLSGSSSCSPIRTRPTRVLSPRRKRSRSPIRKSSGHRPTERPPKTAGERQPPDLSNDWSAPQIVVSST